MGQLLMCWTSAEEGRDRQAEWRGRSPAGVGVWAYLSAGPPGCSSGCWGGRCTRGSSALYPPSASDYGVDSSQARPSTQGFWF